MLLNEIWATDDSTFISITCHTGTIAGFFEAVGHHQFSVGTGVFVPLLVSSLSLHIDMRRELTLRSGPRATPAPRCPKSSED